jgi:hypothetical protein
MQIFNLLCRPRLRQTMVTCYRCFGQSSSLPKRIAPGTYRIVSSGLEGATVSVSYLALFGYSSKYNICVHRTQTIVRVGHDDGGDLAP